MSEGVTFICHAREDEKFAFRLAHDLRAAGVSVWIDQTNLAAGQHWDTVVEQTLANASRLLIILSPDSVGSSTVRDELEYALTEGKAVLPVLYRSCKIPLRLSRMQYIDFTQSYDAGLNRLLQREAIAPAPAPAPRPPVVAPAPTAAPSRPGRDAVPDSMFAVFLSIGSIMGVIGGVVLQVFIHDLHVLLIMVLVLGGVVLGGATFGVAGGMMYRRPLTTFLAFTAFAAAFFQLYRSWGALGVAWGLWGAAQTAALAGAGIGWLIER